MSYEYATPIEKQYFEYLGRIADALEGIRFALVSKIVPAQPPPYQVSGQFVPVTEPYPQIGGQGTTAPNPYRMGQTSSPQPETHVRQVMTQSEDGINKVGWKPYEESKNKE